MSTELSRLPVTCMQDLAAAGKMIAQTGMLGASNEAEGFVIAATCHQQGMSLLEFGETYHLVKGRPTMRADAMLANLHKAGGKHKILSRTPEVATVEIEYNGSAHVFSLSWEEAKKEPFVYDKNKQVKTNYNSPRIRMQMLWARVVSDGVRAMCPIANHGTYSPEEFGGDEIEIISEPLPERPVNSEIIDYSTCPIPSDHLGKCWTEFSSEHLEIALKIVHAQMADGHREEIAAILQERARLHE